MEFTAEIVSKITLANSAAERGKNLESIVLLTKGYSFWR
jgi:hypothetical protein